ncbi:unnamed protein product [Lota lota]
MCRERQLWLYRGRFVEKTGITTSNADDTSASGPALVSSALDQKLWERTHKRQSALKKDAGCSVRSLLIGNN